MEQSSVICMDCDHFTQQEEVQAKMREVGFGHCKIELVKNAGEAAQGKANYKSASFKRACITFVQRSSEGVPCA